MVMGMGMGMGIGMGIGMGMGMMEPSWKFCSTHEDKLNISNTYLDDLLDICERNVQMFSFAVAGI